jgi:hypothetical protein
LFRGVPARPDYLKSIGLALIFLTLPQILVIPPFNALVLLKARGFRRQLLPYLFFDFIFWLQQVSVITPEVQ